MFSDPLIYFFSCELLNTLLSFQACKKLFKIVQFEREKHESFIISCHDTKVFFRSYEMMFRLIPNASMTSVTEIVTFVREICIFTLQDITTTLCRAEGSCTVTVSSEQERKSGPYLSECWRGSE